MGCAASTSIIKSAAERPTQPAPAVQQLSKPEQPDEQPCLQPSRPLQAFLQTKKWKLLMDWCGWNDQDQFGFAQPAVDEIVGKQHGRSILGGTERPHDYQVAVSFPGATFVKGELGSYTNLTDADGNIIAANGAEMAEALRHWLVEDWLEGDERRGLTHVFIDKCNLMYCDGSVLAEGFGKKDAKTAVAVLNENWAIYLREAFLEARCVIFLLNQDWMDSVPCNLEFEGLIKKKRNYAEDDDRRAVIFIDITRSTYSTPALPQYIERLRQHAGMYFDVHSFSYNEQLSPDEKRAVRGALRDLAGRYCEKYDLPEAYELEVKAKKRLNWGNWIYYGSLEGTNGWRTLASVEGLHWEGLREPGEGRIHASFTVEEPFPSRRFRMVVTRLLDGMWGELQVVSLGLYNKATGENIVDFGKGFIKARGELSGVHPATGVLEKCDNKWVDKCGNRQYSWLEWLVPDEQPAVAVGKIVLVVEGSHGGHEWPVDLVFEAMTLEAWPLNGDLVQRGYVMPREVPSSYDFYPGQGDESTAQWVTLHSADNVVLEAGASSTFQVPADKATLACSAYRMRVLEVAAPDVARSVLLPGLQLEVSFPPLDDPATSSGASKIADDVYPVGGGAVTGSGGQEVMEDSGPAYAFTDHNESRWIDAEGGGLEGGAWWQYDHPEAVTLVEYAIKSSINTMGFYDHQHGAPRDWALKAREGDGDSWVVVDQRTEVYFSDFRQLKRFKLAAPVTSRSYRLEFSAVRCGCASDGLVVGDIYLLGSRNAAQAQLRRPLLQHQVWVTPSAHQSGDPGSTTSWATASTLNAIIPLFRRGTHLRAVAGGTARWLGNTTQWYDGPMEFPLSPQLGTTADGMADDGQAAEPGLPGAARTWTGTYAICGRPFTRFRVDFPCGEITLGYRADRPLVLAAYALTAQPRYQRGDPRSWRLEAQDPDSDGGWRVLHAVEDFVYQKMSQTLLLYLPDNTLQAHEYRIVITKMHAPSPHIHTTVAFYERVPAAGALEVGASEARNGDDDHLRFEPAELASLELSMRPREGKCMLQSYTLTAGGNSLPGTPTKWVLEGLASQLG